MTDRIERRAETRIEKSTTVFVEVCSASFDNSAPAQSDCLQQSGYFCERYSGRNGSRSRDRNHFKNLC